MILESVSKPEWGRYVGSSLGGVVWCVVCIDGHICFFSLFLALSLVSIACGACMYVCIC